jgi:methylated-DNA-[protein]-cysteine S-methyltransferase
MDTRWTVFDADIGRCGIAWTGEGIAHFTLPKADDATLLHELRERFGGGPVEAPPPEVSDAIRRIQAHLAGALDPLDGLRLDLTGATPFARRVYEALREVGPGVVVSYGQLAHLVGSPGAARAVGRAMATNPIALLVPCHRVIAASGQLTGFSAHGGLDTKARLLALEGVAT